MTSKVGVLVVDSLARDPDNPNLAVQMNNVGLNTGNIVFGEAVKKIFPTATVLSYAALKNRVNEVDKLVIAAANWLFTGADHTFLLQGLEPFKGEIHTVGLGAQSGYPLSYPKLSETTHRLLSLLSERCTTISVRGQFTAEAMESYGFSNAEVTGCPSLLFAGEEGPIVRPLDTEEAIKSPLIHSTRHQFHKTDPLNQSIYSLALENDFPLLLQSETCDMMAVLEPSEEWLSDEKNTDTIKSAYKRDDVSEILSYLKRRGRFYFNYGQWRESMASEKFCFGSRIHGTIASLVSGCPAVLLAHDSRTSEMGESMGIPYVDGSDMDEVGLRDIHAATELASGWDYAGRYRNYRERFKEYFRRNDLQPQF